MEAAANPPAFDRVRTAVRCDDVARKLVQAFKYSRRRLPAQIAARSGVPALHEALKQVRATPQQLGLSKTVRADNVQGAFRVPPEKKAEVADRRLLLIDDVLTSGATVDTCARALLRAGAAQVEVMLFARVVAPMRATI